MIELTNYKDFSSRKILSIQEAASKIHDYKSLGRKVGMCHGGFDLLHPGHIKHFESARELCDLLVVSVTSDRFLSKAKGDGRPILPSQLRCYGISMIECVGVVVNSDYPKAVNNIRALKPDYYIKGPDYIGSKDCALQEEIAAIKAVGGEIRYTSDPKLSTTEIINYIKEKF